MGKLEKVKHNHLLTTLLKNLIFAIVMLAPFFAVLSRCMYVTFNKNAKDSYSGANGYTYQYKYQTNNVNDLNDLVSGNIYTITITEFTNTTQDYLMFNCHAFYNLQRNTGTYIGYERKSSSNVLNVRHIPSSSYEYFRVAQAGQYILDINFNQLTLPLTFEFVYSSTTNGFNGFTYTITATPNERNILTGVEISNDGTLDNAFEYSVNQLNDMQIFNWTTNTAIYTPINSMCSGLGFTQNDNVIALLLTYWAINTAIYIIFDIVIACFTKLTHFMSSD